MFFISKGYTFVGKEITIFQQQPMCRVEFRWRKKERNHVVRKWQLFITKKRKENSGH